MKKALILFIGVLATDAAQAAVQTLPFTDHFDYPSGNLATVAPGVWDISGQTGPEQLVTNAAALTAPAGLDAASGNGVRWQPTGSARRAIVQFGTISSGTLYGSFLLNAQNAGTTTRLAVYFDSSTSQPSTPQLGVFVSSSSIVVGKKSTSGVSASIGAGTHLIVVRYTFQTGNDQADLWVDPSSATYGAGTAPASLGSTTGGSDANIPYFGIYSSSGAGPSLFIDEVRIATNWAGVVPGTPPPPVESNPVITETLLTADGIVLRGTNGAPNGTFEVVTSTDIGIAPSNWPSLGIFPFDGTGRFDCTNAVSPLDTVRFYRLHTGSTNASPPAITNQPQSQIVLEGQAAQFVVGATGFPLNYQWYFNTNTVLAAGTNATLIISNVQSNDVGGYSVIVSNTAGSATSVVAQLTIGEPITNGDFYVSNSGNDNNPGTYAAPFYSLQKAVDLAQPGNTIYVRSTGGTFLYSSTININHSGTSNNLIKIFAYPGEKPVLDFVNQTLDGNNRGIILTTSGNWWHIKGLEIMRAGDNGTKVEGSHNLFELLVLHHNRDTGLQIGFAHETNNPGDLGAYNTVINCDSYMNFDPPDGQDADAFACKLHPGYGNVFMGCRGWRNCDDGWDLFESDHTVIISNCWTWHNGDASLFSAIGNGNGFKLGGNGSGGSSEGTHYLLNCIAFNNNFPGRTAHGIDQNSHHGGLIIYNCLAFSNTQNYYLEDSAGSNPQIVRNNISNNGTVSVFGSGTIEDHNSWLPGPDETDHAQVNPDVGAISSADFNCLTEACAEAPRQPDGSLPTGFGRLISGNAINKGIDIGLPYCGSAPDLGALEYCP